MAYAGHILRGSSGSNASLLLKWKFEEKKARILRLRRTRIKIDDLLQWTQLLSFVHVELVHYYIHLYSPNR